MANRTKVLDTLYNYMKTKGHVLNSQEYSRETDTPVRIQQIRNIFGSWNRLEKLLMAREAAKAITDVDAVLKARNDAALEAAKQWKEASEDQDAKARREAEAQVVAEILSKNAATPEGANANKIAIGGKLPGEQQDYSAMGATVEKDPVTGEQVIVDTKPEIVKTTVETAKTPQELRDAVATEKAVDTGSVPVDTSTAGGSTGQASTATVGALTGEDTAADKKTTTASTAKTASK